MTLHLLHPHELSEPGAPDVHVLTNDASDEHLNALVPHLDTLARIELNFPKWTDGRAYSQARLLRLRHGYRGELRATGEVLVDMLPLLVRTGFSSAVLKADQSRGAALDVLRAFSGHYQADALNQHAPWHRGAPVARNTDTTEADDHVSA